MTTAVCTLATESCWKDLQVFLFTIAQYNKEAPHIFLLCDKFIENKVLPLNKKNITVVQKLEKYGKVSRAPLERTPGLIYRTRWEDFMMEKTTIMDIAFSQGATSVFFTDCDICFMGPLPQVPPNVTLGLSPHYIREQYTQLYGIYNAGFVYTTSKDMPAQWRKAAHSSRYYDQAALEEVATHHTSTYLFPVQTNYGWWRMYQGTESAQLLQEKWSIFRNGALTTSGLQVEGEPLLSVHTHWHEKNDLITKTFNNYVLNKLKILARGKKIESVQFLQFLVNDLKIDTV